MVFRNWSHQDWSQWPNIEHEFRLEVYNALDELKDDAPQELYEATAQPTNSLDPQSRLFLWDRIIYLTGRNLR